VNKQLNVLIEKVNRAQELASQVKNMNARHAYFKRLYPYKTKILSILEERGRNKNVQAILKSIKANLNAHVRNYELGESTLSNEPKSFIPWRALVAWEMNANAREERLRKFFTPQPRTRSPNNRRAFPSEYQNVPKFMREAGIKNTAQLAAVLEWMVRHPRP
jgi:hypothetical protein